MTIALRAATAADTRFVQQIYFETQRWLIEKLFGWRGDDVELAKFIEFYDEAHTTIVEIGGEAVGWLSVFRDANNIEIQSIYLASEQQRKGLGTSLIRRLIAEADAEDKTVTLSTAKINPALRLYRRLGFVTADQRGFKVYMARSPKHALEQIEIREEGRSDIPGIRAVHESAFGRGNEGRLVDKLRGEDVVAASIVAIDGRRVVGNAIFSRVSVHALSEPILALALAPVAVTPDYQSRSIGSRIIRYGLAVCTQRNYDAVLVLGDPQYYTRFGFSHHLAKKVQSPYSKYGLHWMALELREGSLSPASLEATYPHAFEEVD